MQNDKFIISLPCKHTIRDPGGDRVNCPVCGKVYDRNGPQFKEVPGLNAFATTTSPGI